MALIKLYNPRKEPYSLNNQDLCSGCDECLSKQHKNLNYNTTSIQIFDNIPKETIYILFKEQQESAEKEADLYIKYNWLTQGTYNKTLEQYSKFFFYKNHAYLKEEIRLYLNKDEMYDSTYLSKPAPPIQSIDYEKVQEELQKNNQRGVSRQAIRNITGYTYTPVPEWSKTGEPIYIEWQHQLLEDRAKLIIVNGSRRLGKTYTIAEKATEESFLNNNDTLVGAFTNDSTKNLLKYMLSYIRKFPKGTFTHYKSERCIVNNKSGTTVYFRTLADGAKNILGMTLKMIIIDEAQLIEDMIYEEVLLPTLATTGGKMILIFTPGMKRSGYVFNKIMEIKKGLLPSVSFYEVDITKNPFIEPEERARIMAKRDDPAIRRQWFCEWNDGGETLFDFKATPNFPELYKEGYMVLGIDPARLRDRSGYALIYIFNGKATIIQSGFVPDNYKKDWGLQAIFYLDLIKKYEQQGFAKWYNAIDVSGVGDGVSKIFQDAGIRFNAKLRYTSSATESVDGINYKVGKSVLINTTLDMTQEGHVEIFESTNKFLLEECEYIQRKETNSGLTSFESPFFDDITNATMIAIYTITKLGLLNRKSEEKQDKTSGSKYVDQIERIGYNNQDNSSDVW